MLFWAETLFLPCGSFADLALSTQSTALVCLPGLVHIAGGHPLRDLGTPPPVSLHFAIFSQEKKNSSVTTLYIGFQGQ